VEKLQKNNNPSDNDLSNLEILDSHSEHAKLHAIARRSKNSC